MQIDITKLITNSVTSINIDGEVNINEELLKDSLIDSLKNVKLKAKLILDEVNDLKLIGKLTGIMILKDDVTLEPVSYNFDTEIEEILDKSENLLDITNVLWHNILVEIPSKVRNTDEDIELSGNGWRLISEEEYEREQKESNNPFANLQEMINEKEEK